MANQPKKYKKFVATAATATLVASAIVPVASAKSFSDVAENNEFQPFIDALSDAGIINGYQDGTFKPSNKLTRGQVVKMLGRWVEANGAEVPADWNSVQRFNDVATNNADEELVKYAALVKDAGVFTGSNGNLMASKNITRQQMAKVLNGAFTAVNGTSLVDLADSIDNKLVTDLASAQQEFEGYIQALVDLEISTVSVFRPSENVTRAQFAKFLYNTIDLETVGAAGVKAINNTTVEVTFDGEIEDIEALDFTIEGLEVTNAVVKQTDKTTAVLTTAAQEGGKEYTVSVDGEEVGSFTGIAAVLPEKIEFVNKSIQGVYGQQVTVSAKVTVKEGQSAAGIPVTFNVDSNADAAGGQFAKDYVAEALTNEEGIATYTYTQYNVNNSEDLVTAYATGKANVRATSEVYWANEARLTVKDITEGNTIANSNTKVYQVTSKENKNGYVAVTFKENTGVTPDKVTNGIYFTDATVYSVDSNDNITPSIANFKGVPFEVTTGGHQVALVKLNADGVGNFTLTGADATVTPVVYDFEGTVNDAVTKATSLKYNATDLQAQASSVSFATNQTAQITVEAAGVQAAAARTATGDGGREYTVTLKDKDGKVAPEGRPVYIYFDKKSSGNSNNSTSTNLTLTQIVDGKETTTNKVSPSSSNNLVDAVRLTVDKDGKVKFVVRGDLNDYATPIAVYDNGKSTEVGKIDSADAQATAEMVYFGTAKVGASKAKITSVKSGKEVTSITGNDQAKIEYIAVDQNGYPYYNSTTANFDATFTFTEAFANYTVTGATEVSSENNRKTYKATASNGVVTLYVSSSKGTVYFNASTTNNVLAAQSGSIAFNTLAESATLTGAVKTVDTQNDKVVLTVNGTDVELSYKDANLFYKGSAAGITENYFETKLVAGATVTYNKATDSTTAKFDIIADPAAAADVPVTVTAAQAIDVNGDGNADQVKLTFSKNVDEAKLSATYLGTVKLAGGTVATTVVSDSSTTDNTVTLGVTGITGLTLGTLTLPALVDLGVDLSDFAGTSIVPTVAIQPTLVTGAVAVTTPGNAGTKQVQTLTPGAATATGDAIVSVVAAGFNGNAPLNITVPVIATDDSAAVTTKTYNALKANTTVTNFFDVTTTATTVVLTAKTAAANDAKMAVALANNVATVSGVNTNGVAPAKEVSTITIATPATNAGTVTVALTDGSFSKTVNVSVIANETADDIASKVFAALITDTNVTSRYDVKISGAVITLTEKAGGVGSTMSGTVN